MTTEDRPEHVWETLALTAALPQDRELLDVLLTFDRRLERIAETSSEPMLGQIRLAWWRDTLTAETPPAGEPLIARIQALRARLDWPITEPMLMMIDGWEARLLTPGDRASFAAGRGEGLFHAFAGPEAQDGMPAAARCWALAGREQNDTGPDIRALRRWPRRLRPLSLLALAGRAEGRLAGLRLSWHGLTGR